MAATQENLSQMRGYRTGNGGAVLDCASIEQKKLPHLTYLEDENQASREDEPLKHNDDYTDNSSTDSTSSHAKKIFVLVNDLTI